MLPCRRTYTSSSRSTPNTAAVSMASRERGEDEGGRGGEIVTIALVPAGALRSLLALLFRKFSDLGDTTPLHLRILGMNGIHMSGSKQAYLTWVLWYAGSYASWLAGDNLAPAANAPLGTVGGRTPQLKQRVSGFAANGGAATQAVRQVADALKVRSSTPQTCDPAHLIALSH